MIKMDEDLLTCDLAETYHIFDFRRLPAYKVAVFSCGLKDDSRIKMKLSGNEISFDTMLLAGIFDKVNLLFWTKTKDAEKNKNRPTSIVEMLNGKDSKTDILTFKSGNDFEKQRQVIVNKIKVGGG